MHVFHLGPLLFIPTRHNLSQKTVSSPRHFEFGHVDHPPYVDISYLPVDVDLLPPLADRILRKATFSYVGANDKVAFQQYGSLSLREILDAIDQEYTFTLLPIVVDKFALDPKNDPNIAAFCKILSFSLVNRLPMEITLLLVDELLRNSLNTTSGEPSVLSLKECIQQGGWTVVSFPKGFPLRLNRHTRPKTFIPPWLKDDVNVGQAIKEATTAKAPIKRERKEEIFQDMDKLQVGRSYMAEIAYSPLPLSYNFFPHRSKPYQRIRNTLHNVTRRAVSVQNGGFLVYLILRLLWYSGRMLSRLPLIYSISPLISSFKLRGVCLLLVLSLRVGITLLLSPSAEEAFRVFVKVTKIRFEMAQVLIRFALFCDCVLLLGQILHR